MRAPVVAAIAAGAACAPSASSDPGVDALLQVVGAQYRPGPFPADEGGPRTIQLSSSHAVVTRGHLREKVSAVLEADARGAAIGIEGVDGAWIVPAGPPPFDAPGMPAVLATIGVTDELAPGPFELIIAATNERGFGPRLARVMVADEAPPPAAELVVGLYWDAAADLDIHVVTPDGGEAWSDKPNTLPRPPPGVPPEPGAFRRGGILDHDGNKDCRRDARPAEQVIWRTNAPPIDPAVPPDGRFIVRVDTRAMCGAASAPWYVAVYRKDGSLVDAARGVATPADLRHGIEDFKQSRAGAGVTALEFQCAMGVCDPL